jgi:hypothetical protein
MITSKYAAAITGTISLWVIAACFVADTLCEIDICWKMPFSGADVIALAGFVFAVSICGIFLLPSEFPSELERSKKKVRK